MLALFLTVITWLAFSIICAVVWYFAHREITRVYGNPWHIENDPCGANITDKDIK